MAESEDSLYRVSTLDYWSYVVLSKDTAVLYYHTFKNNYAQNYSFPSSLLENLASYSYVSMADIAIVIFLAYLWTRVRVRLTEDIVKPCAQWAELPEKDADKAPEAVWKLLFYTCTWSLSLYVVILCGRYRFFQDPLSVWDGWQPGIVVPWDIYLMYVMQVSFYMHSFYATLYLDTWRKDSGVMMLHHLLTLSLLGFSFAFRYFAIGALIIFLHDLCDVFLEFAKVCIHFKNHHGKKDLILDGLANFAFLCFSVSWFLFRLYWFPLKALYASGYGAVSQMVAKDMPLLPMFNFMLVFLLFMNAWWFHFILLLLYKVATGQLKEVEDTREYEEKMRLEQERLEQELLANGNAGKPLIAFGVGAGDPALNNCDFAYVSKKAEKNGIPPGLAGLGTPGCEGDFRNGRYRYKRPPVE